MDYGLLANEILVKLLRADDEKAFKEIYCRHWKPLFNAAYYRSGSKETAKEIVQNLFLRIWEKRQTLLIQNLDSYLHSAVKHSIINHFESTVVQKKYYQHIRETFNPAAADTENTLLYNEFLVAFEKAINQLPEKTSAVFRKSRLENLTVREIATSMGLSEKAVEYHITNSLKILRLSLKEFLISGLFVISAASI